MITQLTAYRATTDGYRVRLMTERGELSPQPKLLTLQGVRKVAENHGLSFVASTPDGALVIATKACPNRTSVRKVAPVESFTSSRFNPVVRGVSRKEVMATLAARNPGMPI